MFLPAVIIAEPMDVYNFYFKAQVFPYEWENIFISIL